MVEMMDKDILRLLSVKTGLSLNYLSKEEHLSILLENLSNTLSDQYILKGGTALNRVYLSKMGVARFSEDLDIDYVSKEPVDARIKSIKEAMKRVTGFEVKEPRLLHRTLRFDCRYVNAIGHADVVKVEYYMSHDVVDAAVKPEKVLIGSPYVPGSAASFNCYSLEDLLAMKLAALYGRTEGKDIYDLFYGLETAYDKKTLGKALDIQMRFYKIEGTKEELLSSLIKKLDEVSSKSTYIGNSTNHYIQTKLRPDWQAFIKTLRRKIENLGSI
jgi:hypothetical protein